MLQDVFGLEGERLWAAASGLAGGVSRYQTICGALLGATVGFGLQEGRAGGTTKEVADRVRPRVRGLVEGFRERFGEIECGKLIPFDLDGPGGQEAFKASDAKDRLCHQYVRFVVETVAREKWR